LKRPQVERELPLNLIVQIMKVLQNYKFVALDSFEQVGDGLRQFQVNRDFFVLDLLARAGFEFAFCLSFAGAKKRDKS